MTFFPVVVVLSRISVAAAVSARSPVVASIVAEAASISSAAPTLTTVPSPDTISTDGDDNNVVPSAPVLLPKN